MTIEYLGFESNKRIYKKYGNKPEHCTIGGKDMYVRSQGEKKLAEYLELLKVGGCIKDWAFEQTTFTFPDDKYLVDFDVINPDGTFEYYEWKGFFDARSRRKLQLLEKYRPEVVITMVFANKSGALKFKRSKLSRFCKRVCTLTVKGLIDV